MYEICLDLFVTKIVHNKQVTVYFLRFRNVVQCMRLFFSATNYKLNNKINCVIKLNTRLSFEILSPHLVILYKINVYIVYIRVFL